MKKLVLIASFMLLAFAFVGCELATTEAPVVTTTSGAVVTTTTEAPITTTTEAPIVVQGVTATSIKVGNTAATSGPYAAVGVPFNEGMKAVFAQVNAAGGIDGRTIQFVTYDDTFNAATGLAFTETLIEEDEVFALVGHFGTPTVGATLALIQEVGIPMVYAATGINGLYFAESVGNPVMAVQPIYMTDGRIMAARAIKEAVYGVNGDEELAAGAKIGVIYTNDDVGLSIKAGIEAEAEILGKTADMVYQAITAGTYNTAVTILRASGCAAVILAMNQEPFGYALTSMANLAYNVPIFTSYVNADVTAVDHLRYNVARPIYTNAWLDTSTEAGLAGYMAFAGAMTANGQAQYALNAYAMAGYIAATVFVEGLQRVADAEVELTWENYIAAMEDSEIAIPMGGVVDFSGGHRWGIAAMSLLKYGFSYGDNPATTDVVETDFLREAFAKVREIETIATIEAK
ncbi:MAG: ABC transporter substrate-binding protein [Candidatus Izemoplasmatales bacterium]